MPSANESARQDESDKSLAEPHWLTSRCLEIALVFAVFFVVSGVPAPDVNETYYLTKAKHYWQPDWCAGDPFLESADAHQTFYWTVGWLAKWFSLPTVAWIGRTATWLLLAIAWQRLSSRIIPRPFFAVLTAMLLATLIPKTNFAGEWVFGGVEGKCFAYAFVFWGLSELAVNRWRATWLWLGLASAFHVLVGGWATIAAGIVWLTEARQSRPTLRAMLPALLLGGVLALPGVVPALHLTQGVSAETAAEANQIYVFERLPHHLAPLALPTKELTKKSTRFGLLFAGFALLWLFSRASQSEGSVALNRLQRFAWGSIAFSVFGLTWELAAWNHPAIAAKLLKYYWFRLADIAVPVAAALAVFWLVSVLLNRRPKMAAWLLLATIAYPCWFLFPWSGQKHQTLTPPADRRIRSHLDWQQACQWARENTPTDALFIVPRSSQSFEWYAHRSGLVTWKDVPQDAATLVAWRNRYFDVFQRTNSDDGQRNFVLLAEQGAPRIKQLAKKYQTDYLIARDYPPLLLPKVYHNNSYTIYATPPTPADTHP